MERPASHGVQHWVLLLLPPSWLATRDTVSAMLRVLPSHWHPRCDEVYGLSFGNRLEYEQGQADDDTPRVLGVWDAGFTFTLLILWLQHELRYRKYRCPFGKVISQHLVSSK